MYKGKLLDMGPMLMWTSFLHLGVYLMAQLTSFWKVVLWAVTNCDSHKLRHYRRNLWFVAICDLSQFVIMAVTWHIDSNNTVSVLWVLGRVPMFTFDMNMKSFTFADSGVISLVHLFVSISVIKPIIDVQRKTSWYGSDVDVNIFSAIRNIPYGTIDINLKSCILNRHKLRQSQIATLPSQFVICRNLWSKPWRRKLSPTTLKTCSVYLAEYPCSLLTCIWKLTFLPILVLFHLYICSYVYHL